MLYLLYNCSRGTPGAVGTTGPAAPTVAGPDDGGAVCAPATNGSTNGSTNAGVPTPAAAGNAPAPLPLPPATKLPPRLGPTPVLEPWVKPLAPPTPWRLLLLPDTGSDPDGRGAGKGWSIKSTTTGVDVGSRTAGCRGAVGCGLPLAAALPGVAV